MRCVACVSVLLLQFYVNVTGTLAAVDGIGLPTAITAFLKQGANSATASSAQVPIAAPSLCAARVH